jgi:hypothetical protein
LESSFCTFIERVSGKPATRGLWWNDAAMRAALGHAGLHLILVKD